MVKVAKLKSQPQFRVADGMPELVEIILENCKHEQRGVRLPPIIRSRIDFLDNESWEYCKICGKVTKLEVEDNQRPPNKNIVTII